MDAKKPVDEKKPFHVQVAEKLIQQLQEGVAPWQKSWTAGEAMPGGLPVNATTGKRYRGANVLQLMAEGYDDPRWCTYKQAAGVGAQVRKGEHGTRVQYFKFTEEQTKLDAQGRPVLDGDGKPVKEEVRLERPKVFHASVFNAQQIEGLPPLAPPKEQQWTPIERAEHILKASGADIRHAQQDRAFYRSSTDSIHMPEKGQFAEASGYYSTALHELGHWTGHSTRLDRPLGNPFGSEAYAKEELRAEIASMIVGETVGIGHDAKDHAAYVGNWVKVLKEDPMEILRAAADAEKIHDYVMAFEQQQVQETTQEQAPEQSNVETTSLQPERAIVLGTDSATFYTGAELEPWTDDAREAQVFSDPSEAWRAAIAVQAQEAEALEDTAVQLQIRNQENPRVADLAVSLADDNNRPKLAAMWQQNFGEPLPADLPARLAATVVPQTETAPVPEAPIQQAQGTAERPAPERIYIAVPFEDKDEAKALGAKWDRGAQSWFVPERGDLAKFEKWQAQPPKTDQAAELPKRVQDRLDIWVGMTQGAAEKVEEIRTNPVLGTRYAAEYWMDARPAIAETYDRIGNALGSIKDDTNRETARQYLADRIPQSYVNQAEADFFRDGKAADLPPPAWARGPVPAAAPTQAPPPDQPGQGTAQGQPQQPQERTYIHVPYREKDEAKALGAKWDRGAQSWFVPEGGDLAKFEKWQAQPPKTDQPAPKPESGPASESTAEAPNIEAAAPQQAERTAPAADLARQYLAVPYEERGAAKAAGAQWDKAAKSWYVGPSGDTAKLERWSLEKAANQQGPAMTPREEFADALTAIGCVVTGAHPIMDGGKHRITVQGEAHSEKAGSGFYVGHLDGHPAGYMKNNKTGAEMKWKSKGYSMEPAEKAALAAEAAGKLEARAAEQERVHEQTAQRVGRQMQTLQAVTEPTPYMIAKGIEPQPGVFTDRTEKETVIPAIDATGKQWSVQYVQEDGTKRFAKDSRKEGCFHPVGGSLAEIAKAPAIVIGEGFATANSLSKALGYATVAAFDSGNVPAVAKALHELMPDKPIVIAGDDDQHLEATLGVNPGRKKAEEAAKAVGGTAVFPIFAPGEQARDPKGFTDFNDLANKSALGIEGVSRQIRAVVEPAIERGQAKQAHQQEQKQAQRQERDQERQQRPKRAAKI